MSKVNITNEFQGERPFRCQFCNKQLLLDVKGECVVKLRCHRCKATITMELANPLPDALAVRAGVLVQP